MIQPMNIGQEAFHYCEEPNYSLAQSNFRPFSPAGSPLSSEEYASGFAGPPSLDPRSRTPSISDQSSVSSDQIQNASGVETDEDGKERGRCPHPGCGRVFKDLKAHMLTHQSERPEKCPISTCEYHLKGFARKYDKNRHTLTHYKGTMICGFCPGPGTPAEKSFNRADVFKRHLMSVHGVEQTPPNSRKKVTTASSNKKITDYCSDATGKCSTCSALFHNAQDFYEHLDDCILRVVQQEEPSEAINQQHLSEMGSDTEVKKTMEKHNLTNSTSTATQFDDDNDNDDDCDDDSNNNGNNDNFENGTTSKWALSRNSRKTSHKGSEASWPPATHKNTVGISKRQRKRRFFPQSWGCPNGNIKTKKRILCVFDGRRRLWKDEMMLDNQFEVRLRVPGGSSDNSTESNNNDAYITDLDLETMRRAQGIFSATDEERGPWVDDETCCLMGPSAMSMGELKSGDEDVDLDDLFA